ncbi:MAG TPA: universal stress protein [Candidatus Acidoferrum sp.]|nr:universal stress protein [Candidatus Acidoferrum sp.]
MTVNAPPFHRILVAVDGSAPAKAAARAALRLAAAIGGRLIFCHTIESESVLAYALASGGDAERLLDARRRDGHDLMDSVCEEARDAGLQADLALVEGAAVDAILAAACARSADLIVLGTHGRHGVERLTLGSVAERVVRDARCPVLTVHADEV